MKIYISSSWRNRFDVRELAVRLRSYGHDVFDFTDQARREESIYPPEKFGVQFDPEFHDYKTYLNRPEWQAVVSENRKMIDSCDFVILLLPCGIDATADWAYGVGMGKESVVVGHPKKGERSPVHLWANDILADVEEAIQYFSL